MPDLGTITRRDFMAIAALATGGGLAAMLDACGGQTLSTGLPAQSAPTPGAIPRTLIRAQDFSFDAPDVWAPGLNSVVLESSGQAAHNVAFLRLKEGRSAADLASAMASGPPPTWLQLVEPLGGSIYTPPGVTRLPVTLDLRPGDYVLVSTQPGSDGKPDYARGMIRPIKVAGSPAAVQSEPPVAVTLRLGEPAPISLPPVRPGRQVWKLEAQAGLVHQIAVAKMAPGKSFDDFFAWERSRIGPAPTAIENGGGVFWLAPGARAWFEVEIAPEGDYVVFCAAPAAQPGRSHSDLGEKVTFHLG